MNPYKGLTYTRAATPKSEGKKIISSTAAIDTKTNKRKHTHTHTRSNSPTQMRHFKYFTLFKSTQREYETWSGSRERGSEEKKKKLIENNVTRLSVGVGIPICFVCVSINFFDIHMSAVCICLGFEAQVCQLCVCVCRCWSSELECDGLCECFEWTSNESAHYWLLLLLLFG